MYVVVVAYLHLIAEICVSVCLCISVFVFSYNVYCSEHKMLGVSNYMCRYKHVFLYANKQHSNNSKRRPTMATHLCYIYLH